MLPERVDEMLKNYKTYAGRCKHLDLEIATVQVEIEYLLISRREDAPYHVQNYEAMDMPRGSGAGMPTENLALNWVNGDVPERIDALRREIETLRIERDQKMITVKFVEAWLSGLTEKDRWLIEQQVIEGRYWREIAIEWGRKYGCEYGKDTLRRAKARALEKIYEMAS